MLRKSITTALLVFATAVAAHADTVLVDAGNNNRGQGWLFAHESGCWVITASHVVRGRRNVSLLGADGKRGQAIPESIALDDDANGKPRADVAVMRVAGALASPCPGSSIGDTDQAASFERVIRDGVPIYYERRDDTDGLAPLNMALLGTPGSASSTYYVQPQSRKPADKIDPGDSGGPILMRGAGIGESGLPLGIVIEIPPTGQQVKVLRWDVVRAFFESQLGRARPAAALVTDFKIVGFTGAPARAECLPLNINAANATCGWAAVMRRTEPISLSLDLEKQESISAVVVTFAARSVPATIGITTTQDPSDPSQWIPEHDCQVPRGSLTVECALGERNARIVKVLVGGKASEIVNVRIVRAKSRDEVAGISATSSSPVAAVGRSSAESLFDVLGNWVSPGDATYAVLHVRVNFHPSGAVVLRPRDLVIQASSASNGIETTRGLDRAAPAYAQFNYLNTSTTATPEARPQVNPTEDLGRFSSVAFEEGDRKTYVVSFLIRRDADAQEAVKSLRWIVFRK